MKHAKSDHSEVVKQGGMVVAAAVVVAVEVHRCQIEKESPEHEADRASLTWALPQHSVVFPPLCGHDDSLFGFKRGVNKHENFAPAYLVTKRGSSP